MNARLFPSNWRPARQEIAFARAAGFAALQLPGQEQGLDAARLGEPLPAVAEALDEAGLTPVMEIVVRLAANGRTGDGLTPLAVLEANASAIRALGCRLVHLHLAPLGPMAPVERRRLEELAAPELAAGVALAAAAGFRLGLEHNEPWLDLFASPQSCVAVLAATPGLAFVFDVNHAPPAQVADYLALAPRMSLLHISDTPLPEVNHHLPLGGGTLDLAAYLRALLAGGFAGPAILEIGGLPKSGGYGRDTDAALLDSRERLLVALASAAGAFEAEIRTG